MTDEGGTYGNSTGIFYKVCCMDFIWYSGTVSQSQVAIITNNYGKNELCEGKKEHSYIHISLVLKANKEHYVKLSHERKLEADW